MWEIQDKFSMKIKPAASDTGDPLLLTPGPLTTGKRVKEVMVHDWGSRDAAFLKINTEVLARLPEVVNGGAEYVTVPMQGSGTFAVEAMLTTFVPAGRPRAAGDQRRLRAAREEDPRHREAQGDGTRDARGHAA